jgi:hypothetical protein
MEWNGMEWCENTLCLADVVQRVTLSEKEEEVHCVMLRQMCG